MWYSDEADEDTEICDRAIMVNVYPTLLNVDVGVPYSPMVPSLII